MEFKSVKGYIRIPINTDISDELITNNIENKVLSIRLTLDIAGSYGLNIEIPNDYFQLVNNVVNQIKDIYRVLPLQSELLDNIGVIEIFVSTGNSIKKVRSTLNSCDFNNLFIMLAQKKYVSSYFDNRLFILNFSRVIKKK
ncbi:hypothetical protein FG386_002606 [Cryptosporidium ryanae]|uniref:uncharacterized protein n=1 Tax=Cryptosporidium ryanae TaxID=515981 RepID=UPI00351A0063|nr:hypothetical protein FG386_002606 [Cryptosporidium ryanae]